MHQQELKDNLAIAYKKLLDFRSPLYMAFSYEEKQGHAHLAAIIKDTSYYLNGSIAVMQRLVRDLKTNIPSSIGGRLVSCVIFSSSVFN